MRKRLSAITGNINIIKKWGDFDPFISGICYDSRQTSPGDLFFATSGIHTDGHLYIDKAIEKGAAAVVLSKPIERYREDIIYLQVENPRFDLSPVSAAFYEYPSTKLPLIGVTGTDGKSTTVSLIHQLLSKSGFKAGFLSTVEYSTGGTAGKNPYRQSTPEAPDVQSILKEMVDSGCTYGVIEATSHGLSRITNRLGDVQFAAGVFTNVTHEHLEFHGTLEQYRQDKANLFRSLDEVPDAFGVVNLDDPNVDIFINATSRKVLSYSLSSSEATFLAEEIESDPEGSSFAIREGSVTHRCRIPLPGTVNIENTLAALLVVRGILKTRLEDLLPLLSGLKLPRGRMKKIQEGQNFHIFVDFAHTPGSYEKIFPMMRDLTTGRLIVLFGSAGERDTAKRAIQGKIASEYADVIILADEDPRGEEPKAILKDIASGTKRMVQGKDLFLITDRREAITHAFSIARQGDMVLLLGKGHESSIIYKDGPVPWNEIEVATECLREILSRETDR